MLDIQIWIDFYALTLQKKALKVGSSFELFWVQFQVKFLRGLILTGMRTWDRIYVFFNAGLIFGFLYLSKKKRTRTWLKLSLFSHQIMIVSVSDLYL